MAERHRNRYVLDRESGHPGYQATIVYGTPADLELLAGKLGDAARTPAGSISEYATLKHGSSSRVTLEFRAVEAAEIDRWHAPLARSRVLGWAGFVLFLGLTALVVVGLYALIVW